MTGHPGAATPWPAIPIRRRWYGRNLRQPWRWPAAASAQGNRANIVGRGNSKVRPICPIALPTWAWPIHLSGRTVAGRTGNAEKVAKRHLLALRLQVPAIVAKLPFWNGLEHQIRRVSVKVGRIGAKGFAGKHFRLFEHRLGRNGPYEAI